MLDCFENFIGIRSTDPETAPTSKLYIDDIPGIDVARMAKIAADKNGVAIIQKAIENACDETCEDALNYKPEGGKLPIMRTNSVGNAYAQSNFRDTVLNGVTGQEGISFELRNPDLYQLSRLFIKRIHIKPESDIDSLTVTISDTTNTELTVSDLVAGKVKTFEVNHAVEGKKVSLLLDHSAENFFKAYAPNEVESDCLGCGNKRSIYQTERSAYIKVTGGFGISADVDLACDLDKIKCQILPYLKYAVRWKAAMILALEGQFSDRANFFSQNVKFDDYMAFAEESYHKKIQETVPSLKNILKFSDRNCFECGGLTIIKRSY